MNWKNKSALLQPQGNWKLLSPIRQEVRWDFAQESQTAAVAKAYFSCDFFFFVF